MEAVLVLVMMALAGAAFVGIVVLVVVLIVRSIEANRARVVALAGHALHRDWDFRGSDPGLVDRFRGAPFGRGSGRRAENVISGRHDGREFVAFDYHYTTGSGEDRNSHNVAVVALHLGLPPGVHAPDLAVGPTTTLGRWANALSGRDVPIGDPVFDEHFTVQTPAPEFAADLLLSDVRQVMAHHPNLSWRIAGDSLLVIRPGGSTPEQVESHLQVMDALLDRVPALVWDRLRGEMR